jgi:hypothetical protein
VAKQLLLFQPAYLVKSDAELDPITPAASERQTVGGEQASESGRGTEGAEGLSYVNLRTHIRKNNHSSNHKHLPERLNVKGNNPIFVNYYPEGRLILFNEIKGKKMTLKEMLRQRI